MKKPKPASFLWGKAGIIRPDRLLVLAGLSGLLGFAYNSGNPIGVRFEPPQSGNSNGPVAAQSSSVTPRLDLPMLDNFSPVSWPILKPMVAEGKVLLVDARPAPNFNAGHIPGAVSLPSTSPAEELALFRERFGTDRQVAVYCVNTSCGLSKDLARRLIGEQGFKSVWLMPGGYQEWMAVEVSQSSESIKITHDPLLRPSEDAPGDGTDQTSADWASSGSAIQAVSWGNVQPRIASGEVILLDARPKASFDAGHIPGAISFPLAGQTEEHTGFLEQLGPDMEIVVYCGGRNCALSRQLAEKLTQEFGFTRVSYLAGGFEEWQRAELGARLPGT
jgi:rhodanese-related sulfurtransferase